MGDIEEGTTDRTQSVHGHARLLSTVPEISELDNSETLEMYADGLQEGGNNPLLQVQEEDDMESQQQVQQVQFAGNPDSTGTATTQASSTTQEEDVSQHRGPSVMERKGSNVDSTGDISTNGSDTNGQLALEQIHTEAEFEPRASSNRGLFRRRSRAGNERESLRKEQGQHVQIRTADQRDAMGEIKRRRHRWKKKLNALLGRSQAESDDEDDMDGKMGVGGAKISMHGRLMVQPSRRMRHVPKSYDEDEHENGNKSKDYDEEEAAEKKREETQYRLTTVKGKQRPTTISGMYEDLATGDGDAWWLCCCCCCPRDFNADRVMSAFLHWSFRSPFVVVFGTAAIGWLALTFVFAFGIYLIGLSGPECIGGVDFAKSNKKFTDAYQLSWTTFSTVGYGLIYPATSANYQPIRFCTLISVFTTFESFVGVLFSSLCAALMFAKVARAQSFAQVTFTDPMVIRYGNGVTASERDDDDDEEESSKSGDQQKGKHILSDFRLPCPVLEFRIVNRMDGIHGGEIIDATLNMVASIDASQADHAALTARGGRRRKGKKKRGAVNRNNKFGAMRHQRGLSGDASTFSSEKLLSELSPNKEETPEPENPTTENPDAAQLHQSFAARGSPVLPRGPAPSLTSRTTNPETLDHRSPHPMQQQQYPSQHGLVSRRTRNHHGDASSFHSGRHSLMQRINSFASGRQKQDSHGSLFNQHNLDQVTMRNKDTQAFEEDPSGKIMSRKILSKLEVDSPDHPFFRRIWLVRHTLDMNSLLLKPHVRELLRRNHGFWPKELNNYESIRASLEFDQILVSFSGTSNADANSVYAQHVYSMVDVNVGYRFVNALYRDETDGCLRVDQSLINDVMEQAGGGGEPFLDINDPNFTEMLVL